MVDKLYSFITSKSMSWAFDKIKEIKKRQELQAKIRDYISNYYSNVFYDLSFDEEFDFEGLNQYLTQQFESKIIVLFNSPCFSTRKWAEEQLFIEAYYYAKAETQNQKQIVYHYLKVLLNIVEKHFLDQIDDKQWFLGQYTLNEIQVLLTSELSVLTTQLTERIDYHGSFAEMIDNMEQEPSNTYQFHYRNEKIRFHGRQAEMAALTEFVEEDKKISIAIITGPGGVGKSKLVYYFLNSRQYDFTWKMLFITQHDIRKILQFHEWKYSKKLLLVCDYAGFVSKDIGEWLLALSRQSSTVLPVQLKIILIERQGFSFDRSGQRIEPYWYRQLLDYGQQERIVKSHLFENEQFSPFLQLPGLQRTDLYNIIDDYARSHDRKLNLLQKEKIVKYVEKIEENDTDSRPLILLLVADAYLNGKPLGNWRITDLMTNILDRYKITWLNTLCDKDQNLYDDLQYIMTYATALGGWDVQSIGGAFQQPSERLLAINSKRLINLICGINNSTEYKAHIDPIKPDLIGEFFVLEFLWENSVSKEKLQAIVNELWQGDNFPVFLLHCISDYAQEPHYFELFENGMDMLLPDECTFYQGAKISILLKCLCGMQKTPDCENTVNKLHLLEQEFPSKTTLKAYAQGLFMLVVKETEQLEKAESNIALLADLYQNHPDNETLIITYAEALRWVINEYHTNESLELIQVFENNLICCETIHNAQIKLEYAKALLGIFQGYKLDRDFVENKLNQLKKLCEDSEDDELLDIYCYALLCTIHYFDISLNGNHSLLELKNLVLQRETTERIYLYAYALIVLLNDCIGEQTLEILSELEDWALNTDNQEILPLYVNSVFLHIHSFNHASAMTYLKHIEELVEEHGDNSFLVLNYASGLFSLYATDKNLDYNIPVIIQDLFQKYGNVQELHFSLEIILQQIEMLKVLRTRDTSWQITETLKNEVRLNGYGNFLSELDQVLLQKLIDDYNIYHRDFDKTGLEIIESQIENNQVLEYRILYALAIVSVMQHSNRDTALSLLSKFRAFADQYQFETGIAFLYFQALIMMFFKTDFRTMPFLKNEIYDFAEQHKKAPAIALLYCVFLSMQLMTVDGEEAEDVFAKILEICNLYDHTPGFDDFKILAMGGLLSKDNQDPNLLLPEFLLFDNPNFFSSVTASIAANEILSAMQKLEPEEKLSALRKLCDIASQYPNDENIAKSVASGFYEVSIDTDWRPYESTFFMQIDALIETHGMQNHVCDYLNVTLHNFLVKQEQEQSTDKTVFLLLEKLYQKNQEVLSVGETYAMWLYSLFIEDSTEHTQSAEKKLKMLSDRFPNSEEITSLYNITRDIRYLLQCCQSIANQDSIIAKEELGNLSNLFPLRSKAAWKALSGFAFKHYLAGKHSEAEILFYASSLASARSRINLAYMARRGECRLFTAEDAKVFLNVETDDPFAIINYALLLAIADHKWTSAHMYMKKLKHQDLTKVMDWWGNLHEQGDPEGTLVMAWLAFLQLIKNDDNISLSKLKQDYFPDLPDWLTE